MKNILITGGAGFIGSHICLTLLQEGYFIYIVDSFINSKKNVFDGINKIVNLETKNKGEIIKVFEGDIRSKCFLEFVFLEASKIGKPIDGVIHLAGLKAARESNIKPLKYWDINVNGSINLFRVMDENNCRNILFSSSASIYSSSSQLPFKESSLIKPTNPYAHTKYTVECILQNLINCSNKKWRVSILRYFNPVGAHPSGLIGEDPLGIPENLFPLMCQVASGFKEKLYIFGNDWPTLDGTCHRDYIHVVDLASFHKIAIENLLFNRKINFILNVGTGKSYSILELINTFEVINKVKINYHFTKRIEGDIAISFANTEKILKDFNWAPKNNLEDMCRDSWRWQKRLLKQ